MTPQARRRKNAEAFAAKLATTVGEHGAWLIYDGGSWYGFYDSRETAKQAIERTDSLGFTVKGTVVQIPPQ